MARILGDVPESEVLGDPAEQFPVTAREEIDLSCINVFDTSMYSDNLGDGIIMEAVYDVLRDIFPSRHMEFFATHNHRKPYHYRDEKKMQFSFVGGSNILSHNMLFAGNWRLTPRDFRTLRNVILLGTGWGGYTVKLRPGTSYFYENVLSPHYLHSVRDMHTYQALSAVIPNVVYTACPTMWSLSPDHCASVQKNKSKNVVFALTYYKPDPDADRGLYRLLQKHYERVYFWPQQHEDAEYARSLGMDGLHVIGPVIGKYNQILENEDVDVIGSRLHGGIRALQLRRRAIILAVDNRAREMGRTTGLPVIERYELDVLESWIKSSYETRVTLPEKEIARWKAQFANF
jgi:polysaccharide pyruvyl transferase WcaK-like protein